tara:strand:- start:65622 stop:67592 length:1971 start_codon:yes stop_codon:yes gene_type:complete
MELPRIGITAKLILVFLGVCLIPIVVVSVIGIAMTLNTLETSSTSSLQASANLQKIQIQNNLRRVVKDVTYLSEMVSYAPANIINAKREVLEFSKSRPEYYQVRYLGDLGHEVIRSNFRNNLFFLTPEANLQYKGNRYYFQKGVTIKKGSVYFSAMDFNLEHGKLELPKQMVIRIVTPVYYNERKQGIVVLNMFAKQFFKWMQLPGTPFTTFLVDENGVIIHTEKNNNELKVPVNVNSGVSFKELYPSLNKQNLMEGNTIVNLDDVVLANFFIQDDGNFNLPPWRLVTVLPKSHFDPKLNVFTLNLMIALFGAAVFAVLAAVFFGRRFTRPIEALSEDVLLVAEGQMDSTLDVRTGDELEDLVSRYNRMKLQLKSHQASLLSANATKEEELRNSVAEIRQLERELYKQDKLASLGELSMGLAHEIGNPLASIKTVAQALSEETEYHTDKSSHFAKIVSEVDRLNSFLKKFNNFAVIRDIDLAPCDICELVRDVVFFLKIQAKEKKIELNEVFEDNLNNVMVDPQQIKQVIVNLILNSIQATANGGAINISVRTGDEHFCCELRDTCFTTTNKESVSSDDREFIEISVCDTGHGIPGGSVEKIFDPFYSTKPDGTGLGLSVVHRIVDQHMGTIQVYSKEGWGTTLMILLPKTYSKES